MTHQHSNGEHNTNNNNPAASEASVTWQSVQVHERLTAEESSGPQTAESCKLPEVQADMSPQIALTGLTVNSKQNLLQIIIITTIITIKLIILYG